MSIMVALQPASNGSTKSHAKNQGEGSLASDVYYDGEPAEKYRFRKMLGCLQATIESLDELSCSAAFKIVINFHHMNTAGEVHVHRASDKLYVDDAIREIEERTKKLSEVVKKISKPCGVILRYYLNRRDIHLEAP